MLFLFGQFYLGVALAINKATGPDRRGELNGISSGVGSLANTIAPIIFATLFAFSIDGDRPFPFDYHCAFYSIGAVRLTVAVMAWNRINDIDVVEKPDTDPWGLNRPNDAGNVEMLDSDSIGLSKAKVADDVENRDGDPMGLKSTKDAGVAETVGTE